MKKIVVGLLGSVGLMLATSGFSTTVMCSKTKYGFDCPVGAMKSGVLMEEHEQHVLVRNKKMYFCGSVMNLNNKKWVAQQSVGKNIFKCRFIRTSQ